MFIHLYKSCIHECKLLREELGGGTESPPPLLMLRDIEVRGSRRAPLIHVH